MFIEPHLGGTPAREQAGWIELICGCMFSGKTEELIRRLNRAIIAKQKVEIRLTDNNQQVMLGERNQYEARGRTAFLEGMKARKK